MTSAKPAQHTKITCQKDLDKALKAKKYSLNFTKPGEYEINDETACIDVYSEAELNIFNFTIKTKTNISLCMRGCSQPHVEAWGSSQPHVEAWGSSQPHVVAWGSSQPHVEAWGSSQPHVEARESSQPRVEAWESSQPHVEAWESSQPHVVAWGSSQPHVVAWGSSQPHVEARGSSQPHVEAWGSSQPHVEAWGSSQPHVVARESSQPRVVATGYVQLSIFGKVIASLTVKCHAMLHGTGYKVDGGQQTVVDLRTAQDWCDYYGVKVENGLARVYKALRKGFASDRDPKFLYLPGTTPKATAFNNIECSDGLHFSPHPVMTHEFVTYPDHYVECWIDVSKMLVFFNGSYPGKCKAPQVELPVIEVDIDGKHITQKVAA